MQQFRAGFEAEFATAALSAARCSMQFVLPNRTPLPATREAGLVQISSAVSAVLRCENISRSEAAGAERCGYGDLQ